MEHRSRGDADYRFGYDDDELARLGEQHRVWAEENQRLLERAGFGAGATVVTLGQPGED